MVIEHNGQIITLPDVPADVLVQYPYWLLIKSQYSGEQAYYAFIGSSESFLYGKKEVVELIGFSTDIVLSVGTGRLYFCQSGDSAWNEDTDTDISPIFETVGEFEDGEGFGIVLSANHDIYEAVAIDVSTGTPTPVIGGMYFLNSTIEYEPEYTAPSSWFVGLANRARSISGVKQRYDIDELLDVFDIPRVEGVEF